MNLWSGNSPEPASSSATGQFPLEASSATGQFPLEASSATGQFTLEARAGHPASSPGTVRKGVLQQYMADGGISATGHELPEGEDSDTSGTGREHGDGLTCDERC